ncbi:MAG: penicillin-binding protein [Eubacterium sp.]|nr:penicillin-binding protein [Eubacterium sp.]MCM1214902.1 penicillin-binding protein [Lachnospiraceae bacterium]MCM1303529.1 penicillin-binding protein [Butyrivibrio sp.]MCM1342707.1 hypothetical protein [Muribaculaceae bacterium]MCM1238978.1 penicillin-binding protein [Lachnospiraceae bacterium]
MKKVWAFGIITGILIVAAVLLRGPMANADVEYEEVKVTVVSSDTVQTTYRTGYSRSTTTEYEIKVLYQGKEYDLKNAHNAYSYREGSTVTAYLSNGKLYANVEGVQTSTPVATAYFVALIGALVMFFVFICTWSSEAQKKRRARKEEQ